MNWIALGLFSVALALIVFAFGRPPTIIVEDEDTESKNKSYHDNLVDSIIDYRFYSPWAHYGYRTPYLYRVGGTPYRQGLHWRGRDRRRWHK